MKDQLLLDIAMNLTRIGNWAADDFVGKQNRIQTFLKQTDDYLKKLPIHTYPPRLQKTLSCFQATYDKLTDEAKKKPEDSLRWAEEMMTWGNILTHRANLTA
ncbi:hypothetical protein HYV22_02210 [Candidatus Gottesmanbacteria bacterium]|nr:hypothetical protein [Candidatus Gottesmanbacteria bacterium]